MYIYTLGLKARLRWIQIYISSINLLRRLW